MLTERTLIAHCPECGRLVDEVTTEPGYRATFPAAVVAPGGTVVDGHVIGTGERPAPINGISPRMAVEPLVSMLTLEPCGHELRGEQIEQFRLYART